MKKTYAQALDVLKKRICEDDDFSDTFNSFFDLVDDHDFFQLGKRGKSPILKGAIKAAGENLFAEKVQLTNVAIIHIKQKHFYHGAVNINDHFSSVIYFDDVKMGLLSIATPELDQRAHILRFTAVVMDNDKAFAGKPSEYVH